METSSTMLPDQKIQDRFDEQWTPQTRFAVNAMNALKNIKSAPVEDHSKLGILIKTRTDLNVRRPDLGLLDLFVDDGTSGNLDDGLRSLRFSAAASNIDHLFTPMSKKGQVDAPPLTEDKTEYETPATQNKNVSTESMPEIPILSSKEPKENDFQKAVMENPTNPVESTRVDQETPSILAEEIDTVQPVKDFKDVNVGTATEVNGTPESLVAEPITPPHVAYKREDTLGNEQSPKPESPDSGEETTSPRMNPVRLLKSTMKKARRLSSLFSKTSANSDREGEGGSLGTPVDHSSTPKEGTPQEGSAPSPRKTGSQLRQLLSKLSSGRRNRSSNGTEDDRGMQGNRRANVGVRLPKFFKRKSEEAEETEPSPSEFAITGEDNGAETGPSSSPPPENRAKILVKKVTGLFSKLVE